MSPRLFLICSSFVVILSIPVPLTAQERDSRVRADGLRTITVVGEAEESVTPDLAELTVGVETRSVNANEALAANGKEMTALMDVLKNQGIATKDVQTSGLNLSPVREKPKADDPADKASAKIVGYAVTNKVVVTIRDPRKVGELLDMMVKAGVNQIHDLEFTVSDTRSRLRDLRKRALADAREQADEAAKTAGMVRGNPISIRLDDFGGSDSRFAMRGMAGMGVDRSQSTPIALGQETLRSSVEVVYEMRPPG